MICFCLNNLRSESWMDAEYGNWSFEGMTLLWRCCKIQNFSGQEECIFEKLCILWFWIYLQDSGLVTTAGFVLGGRWASSLTEGTTNVNWLKESSVEMEAARLWQFLRTGKICIYFENCSDCGLEKLQDLRCDCMLCAEIGSLASRGEALFDHEELAKCWRFKAWSSVDILTSLVCV